MSAVKQVKHWCIVTGDACEKCAINHFGDPTVVNGTCTSCYSMCNNNIDMSLPGSCDPVDGRCLTCQRNTEGDNCQLCANGYFGDATDRTLDKPCVGKWYPLSKIEPSRQQLVFFTLHILTWALSTFKCSHFYVKNTANQYDFLKIWEKRSFFDRWLLMFFWAFRHWYKRALVIDTEEF